MKLPKIIIFFSLVISHKNSMMPSMINNLQGQNLWSVIARSIDKMEMMESRLQKVEQTVQESHAMQCITNECLGCIHHDIHTLKERSDTLYDLLLTDSPPSTIGIVHNLLYFLTCSFSCQNDRLKLLNYLKKLSTVIIDINEKLDEKKKLQKTVAKLIKIIELHQAEQQLLDNNQSLFDQLCTDM